MERKQNLCGLPVGLYSDKKAIPCHPARLLPGACPKNWQQRLLEMSVHPMTKRAQRPMEGWRSKQNADYKYKVIAVSLEREETVACATVWMIFGDTQSKISHDKRMNVAHFHFFKVSIPKAIWLIETESRTVVAWDKRMEMKGLWFKSPELRWVGGWEDGSAEV